MPRPPAKKVRVKIPKQEPATPAPLVPDVGDGNRVRLMWASVIGVMVVVVIAWVALLRFDTGGANPFRDIFEQVKGVFVDEAPTSAFPTEQADDEQLRELRERVFPQFSNINSAE